MSPVDGSLSVFQVVVDLPPGYHQYKFIVDGEWRHDDRQTCMPDPLGNVNNWLLVKEPENSPAPAPPSPAESPVLGASMEVDHDLNQARGSQVASNLAAHSVTAAEAEASRQRISEFLLRHSTAYDLLPQSGKVVTLDITLPVRQAFHALYEQGVATAPLWDSERHEFVGMLTASDFIVILRQFGSNGALLSEEEELDTHTIAAWKQEKLAFVRQVDGATSQKRPFLFVGPDCSLRQVADILLQHEVATVPVLHYNGSVPELLHLACLSGILKCICRHFRHVAGTLPLLTESIGALQRFQPLGTWIPELSTPGSSKSVTMLRANAPLIMALALLLQVQVSALPIVDDNGCLLDVYCRSDITALARDRVYTQRPLHEFTVAQALQIRNEAQILGVDRTRCQLCRRAESLRSVMERLALPGVRRLICVEEGTRRVEGIISLRDVFQFLLA